MMPKIKFSLIVAFIFIISGISAQVPFTGKPTYQILTKRAGIFLGIIKVELFPNIAPLHVRNFDSLVNTHFYDTTAFHRVIPGFMIQGGDPNSRHGPVATWGFGSPGQPTVKAEFSAAKHLRGILSAARQGGNINSATSQFFICVANYPSLDGQYSIYGKVTAGMNFVDTIVSSPRDMTTNNPFQKIEMFVTRIGSNDTIPNAPLLLSPTTGTTGIDTLPSVSLKWKSVSDAIIYHLDVSTDSLFSTTIKSIDLGSLSYNLTGLTGQTKYYWRVRTNNGGHFSNYTPVWTFQTVSILDTKLPTLERERVDVTPFPNPSSGNFTFNGLTKGSVISVFDVTGKLVVSSLIKDSITNIDLKDKAKGVYPYRVLLNNKEIKQGKLIIR